MKKNIGQKSIIGSFWVFLQKFLDLSIRILLTAILARIISPDDFGSAQIINITTEIVTVVSLMGMNVSLIQKKTVDHQDTSTAFQFGILSSLVFGILIYLCSGQLAALLKQPELEPAFKLISILPAVNAIGLLCTSLLTREFRFKEILKIDLYTFLLVYPTTTLLLALNGYGYWSLIWGNVLYAVVKSSVYALQIKPVVFNRFSKSSFLEMWKFGITNAASRIVNLGALKGEDLTISYALGAKPLGFYGRAKSLQGILISTVGAITSKVLYTAMTQRQDENQKLANTSKRLIGISNTVIIPLICILMVCAHSIVLVFFGSNWLSIVPLFQILSIGIIFRINYKVMAEHIRAKDRVKYILYIQIIAAALVLSTTLVFAQHGLTAICIAVSGVMFIQFILFSFFLNKSNTCWKIQDCFYGLKNGIIFTLLTLVAFLISRWLLNTNTQILNDLVFLTISAAFYFTIIRYYPRAVNLTDLIWAKNLVLNAIKNGKNSRQH